MMDTGPDADRSVEPAANPEAVQAQAYKNLSVTRG